MPYLIDDGTLDTVIRCECGREHRFNFEPDWESDGEVIHDSSDEYDEFVEDCIADVTDSCECHEIEGSHE